MTKAPLSTGGKRLFLARHGETVYNAAGRMQGMDAHTPLTQAGCAQATAMGDALSPLLGAEMDIEMIASPSGRTLQTLALIAEQVGLDWHRHRTDARLREIDIGSWEGRYYTDIRQEYGDFIDMENRLFARNAPDGESYADIARRLADWLSEQQFTRDMIVISHGMTSRVLRGMMLGLPPMAGYDAPIADSLPQGSMVMICDGSEQLLLRGGGEGERA